MGGTASRRRFRCTRRRPAPAQRLGDRSGRCDLDQGYRVLPGFTGFYWVLEGFQGFYWVPQGFQGFYWVFKGFDRVS